MKVRVLLCMVIAAGLAVGGCGGEGSLTVRAFRREASRICRRGNARIERVHVAPLRRGSHAGRGIERVVAAQRDTLHDLNGLRPPKQHATTIDKWLAIIDQMINETDQVRVLLDAGHVPRAHDVANRVILLAGRARALARDYGVTPCRMLPESIGL